MDKKSDAGGTEDYTEGFKYGTSGKLHEAVECYTKAAEKGHYQAPYQLAMIYKGGKGVDQDYAKAEKFFKDAITRAGSHLDQAAYSNYHLGLMYEEGHLPVVPKDYKDYTKAAKYYAEAAKLEHKDALKRLQEIANGGNPEAQYQLGVIHKTGHVVPKNYAEAVKRFEEVLKTKKNGYGELESRSLFHLGEIYKEGGHVVPKDDAKAVEYFSESAKGGNAEALKELTLMAKGGNAEALKELTLMAKGGNAEALKLVTTEKDLFLAAKLEMAYEEITQERPDPLNPENLPQDPCPLKGIDFSVGVMDYNKPVNRHFYVLRYFSAYLEEYQFLYSRIIQDNEENDNRIQEYRVLSIGCGNAVDYDGLRFALLKADRSIEQVSYTGVDIVDWGFKGEPGKEKGNCVFIKGNIADPMLWNSQGEPGNENYGSTQNNIGDSNHERRPRDCNILIFPKSLGELSKSDISNGKLAENIKRRTCNGDILYIAALLPVTPPENEGEETHLKTINGMKKKVLKLLEGDGWRPVKEIFPQEKSEQTERKQPIQSTIAYPRNDIYEKLKKLTDARKKKICKEKCPPKTQKSEEEYEPQCHLMPMLSVWKYTGCFLVRLEKKKR